MSWENQGQAAPWLGGYWNTVRKFPRTLAGQAAPWLGGYWNSEVFCRLVEAGQAAPWLGGYWNMSAILGKQVSDQAALDWAATGTPLP